MKSSSPVAGSPAPAIDACTVEAQAAAGRARRRASTAVAQLGPDRLAAASSRREAGAHLLVGSRLPRKAVHVLQVVPGPGWPAVRGWAGAAPPRASTAAAATGGTPSTSSKSTTGTTSSKSTTGATSAKSTTGTSTSGEWGFLNDTHMSIEDKLFKFMTLVQKKNDKELEDKIREFKASYTKAGSSSSGSTATSKSSGGGVLGFVKKALSALPPMSVLSKMGVDVDKLLDNLVTQLGPKLLSLAAIPLGVPVLAPAIEKAASELLKAADGGSSASTGSSSSGGTKEAGTPDEKLAMLEIQRLVEKQNQMFTCISNVMKSMHDAGMSAVNNIR